MKQYDAIYVGGAWVAPASADRLEVESPVTEGAPATLASGGLPLRVTGSYIEMPCKDQSVASIPLPAPGGATPTEGR